MTDAPAQPAPLVYEQTAEVTLDSLEDALTEAFTAIPQALADGRPVVIVVADADLLGHGEPAAAALAGGLLGMARALAIEGVRDGWQINVLAVTDLVTQAQRETWVQRLSEPAGASGELFRLGDLHHGRVRV